MIFKFQQGGNSIPPLVSYEPVIVTGGTAASSSSSKDTSSSTSSSADLTDKDLLEMLEKLQGLPSDMEVLTTTLQNFYIDQQYDPFPNTANIASRYLSALYQMQTANFNRKEYDNAYQQVSQNGGINEFAISDRGQLVCVNKEGDFQLLTIDQLKDNTDYQPLTNSELLQLRAYSPQLSFNNDILKVVQNGIGMEAVNKMIQEGISKLGTTQETQEGYIGTSKGKLINGLHDFMEAVQQASGENYNGTVNDLYKYKYLTKEQATQAQETIKYIYKTLPENAKTLLKIKASKATDQGAIELISSLIASQIDSTKDFTLELEGGPTKDSSKSPKDNTDLKSSFTLDVMKGIGGDSTSILVDRGDGIQLSVSGEYYPQIKTAKNEPIVNTSLETMLAESGLQSIINSNSNITFGDQKITKQQLANITYNNSGLTRANLPVNPDGSVRLSILEDYNKAQTEIKLLGDNATLEQIKQIYEDNNLSDLVLSNGRENPDKFAPFIIVEGYTTSENGIKDSEYIKEVRNPTDQEIELIQSSLATGTGKDRKVPEVDTFSAFNPFDYSWLGGYDHIYKAAVYIPISNNVNMAIRGANQSLDYDETIQWEQKYRNFDKLNHLKTTSSDVL